VLAGCVVAGALLIADIHPASDVIGAVLLAITALTGAQTAGLGNWAAGRTGKARS
jgi:hypothetical protein